ncbi:uncharacterized protein GGS22DRAFT_13639 [Annulohypoxylon maeteangense]|uniref:uncharacterized protein n=1 Tax=Annulohypoxylon maeteangense TaxID=1927788 RepID=UPI0020085196|nr:uncharacterized protein GGS22DRAFT_13639 [Annulohypoxylon maeteangense]KAI0890442.1 hypothetical protein GGS22DRAFT_13639 [Annulohypoxylon maeteangense]
MGKLSTANPRAYLPSRAHPEHRSARKELEKEHPFDWTGPLVLGMIGIGLAWDIEKQVKKREERKEREGQESNEKDERRRRRREQQIRNGTFDPDAQDNDSYSQSSRDRRSSHAGRSDRGSDRSVAKDTVDLEKGRRSRRDRGRSVDRREDPRYIEDDLYYEQSRYDRGYDDSQKYQDYYDHGGRSRRDSW